mgnify:CR=1 FL=1
MKKKNKKAELPIEEQIDYYGLEDRFEKFAEEMAEVMKESVLNKARISTEIQRRLEETKQKIIHKACGIKQDSLGNLGIDEYYYSRVVGLSMEEIQTLVVKEIKPLAEKVLKEAVEDLTKDEKFIVLIREQFRSKVNSCTEDCIRDMAREKGKKIANSFVDQVLNRKIKKSRARMHGKVLIKGSSEEVPITEEEK